MLKHSQSNQGMFLFTRLSKLVKQDMNVAVKPDFQEKLRTKRLSLYIPEAWKVETVNAC
jgi:hypothetical protein